MFFHINYELFIYILDFNVFRDWIINLKQGLEGEWVKYFSL